MPSMKIIILVMILLQKIHLRSLILITLILIIIIHLIPQSITGSHSPSHTQTESNHLIPDSDSPINSIPNEITDTINTDNAKSNSNLQSININHVNIHSNANSNPVSIRTLNNNPNYNTLITEQFQSIIHSEVTGNNKKNINTNIPGSSSYC